MFESDLKILLMLKLKFTACGCRKMAFVSLYFRASERPYNERKEEKRRKREKCILFFLL
jgi:hypothetical protein